MELLSESSTTVMSFIVIVAISDAVTVTIFGKDSQFKEVAITV